MDFAFISSEQKRRLKTENKLKEKQGKLEETEKQVADEKKTKLYGTEIDPHVRNIHIQFIFVMHSLDIWLCRNIV